MNIALKYLTNRHHNCIMHRSAPFIETRAESAIADLPKPCNDDQWPEVRPKVLQRNSSRGKWSALRLGSNRRETRLKSMATDVATPQSCSVHDFLRLAALARPFERLSGQVCNDLLVGFVAPRFANVQILSRYNRHEKRQDGFVHLALIHTGVTRGDFARQ